VHTTSHFIISSLTALAHNPAAVGLAAEEGDHPMEPTADATPLSPRQEPLILDKSQGLLPILLANPDYIPAEVSLETIGYFSPSSKRIKHILTKEKILTEKLG